MDAPLSRARKMIESLSLEVRRERFPGEAPRRGKGRWEHRGISFHTEVPAPLEDRAGEAVAGFTIVTPHAREAALLLDRISEIFQPFLDECTERDFYERLAEASVEYCCYVNSEDARAVNLLKVIMAEAEEILEEMIVGEFPYLTSP